MTTMGESPSLPTSECTAWHRARSLEAHQQGRPSRVRAPGEHLIVSECRCAERPLVPRCARTHGRANAAALCKRATLPRSGRAAAPSPAPMV